MTKRTKPRKNWKLPLIVLAGVLVLAGAAGLYFWKLKSDAPVPSNIGPSKIGGSINYGPPSADEKNTSEQQKEVILKENESKPPANASLSVTISRANQIAAGQPLQVRTVVGGTTSGTCTIKLTKTGQTTIEKTVDITPDATYVACNTNIAISEFGAPGDWDLSVTVNKEASTSPPAMQKVTINK